MNTELNKLLRRGELALTTDRHYVYRFKSHDDALAVIAASKGVARGWNWDDVSQSGPGDYTFGGVRPSLVSIPRI